MASDREENAEAAEVLRAVMGEVGERPCPAVALKVACEEARVAGQAPGAADDDERLWLDLAAETLIESGPLELTSWLCTISALTLWGPGTLADADALATYVAEAEGGDHAELEAAFAPVVERWLALGALNETERLTPLGWWGLPEAQLLVWS